jgi:predicted site-specific integrase-resolvase
MGKRLADWAKENNISSAWAHKLYHAGKIPNATQISPRIIIVNEPPLLPQPTKTIIYSRVSSQDQKQVLPQQTQRTAAWAALNGYTVDQVIEEIASGLNDNRKKWLTILKDPTITTILVEHRDRATRFGYTQLQTTLKASGRQLIATDSTEIENDLIRDMTEILTSFCARLYGQRGAKIRAQKALEASKDE